MVKDRKTIPMNYTICGPKSFRNMDNILHASATCLATTSRRLQRLIRWVLVQLSIVPTSPNADYLR